MSIPKQGLKTLFLILLFTFPAVMFGQVGPPELYTPVDTTGKKFKDLRHMGDVFNSNKFLLGKGIISGNLSYNFGRIVTNLGQNGSDFDALYRSAIGIRIDIKPYKEFKLRTNFFYSLNSEAKTRWTPDFQYAFGKFDWRPGTWNYGYENYSNNFYSDTPEELVEKFLDGYWFLSYQHALPNKIMEKIRIDSTSNFMMLYFVRYALQYRNRMEEQVGGVFNGKPVFSIGSRYIVLRNFYVEGSINQYVNPEIQKMPWDADFTYGFGYYDWRSFRFSLTYGNYSVNRFPWNKKELEHYGFIDGNFTLMFNYIW